ncbi:hypothetical protein ACFVMC_06235 [Nocardia sp. NPDC127579]|uniref:hypothetical protein n=1 Tax=Nocardia sp. NPDC127579 TaxID=3345402 RepID=UPI00363A6660
MEPVTVIVAAIAAGAGAGATQVVSQAIGDAYTALKDLLGGRYGDIDVAPVQRKPESAAKRESLAEDLAAAGADQDTELLDAARAVIAAVRAHAATVGPAIGVDLHRIEAAALRIGSVESTGTGVRAVDAKIHGEIEIQRVRAGQRDPDPTRARR